MDQPHEVVPHETMPAPTTHDDCVAERNKMKEAGASARSPYAIKTADGHGVGAVHMLTPLEQVALGGGTCKGDLDIQKAALKWGESMAQGDHLQDIVANECNATCKAAKVKAAKDSGVDVAANAQKVTDASWSKCIAQHKDDPNFKGKNRVAFMNAECDYGSHLNDPYVPEGNKPPGHHNTDNVFLESDGSVVHQVNPFLSPGWFDEALSGWPWWAQWVVPGAAGAVALRYVPGPEDWKWLIAVKGGSTAAAVLGTHYALTGSLLHVGETKTPGTTTSGVRDANFLSG